MDPLWSTGGRQIKIDGKFHSLIQVTKNTTVDPVGPRRTGELDCMGLRTVLRGDERAGKKKPRLYCSNCP